MSFERVLELVEKFDDEERLLYPRGKAGAAKARHRLKPVGTRLGGGDRRAEASAASGGRVGIRSKFSTLIFVFCDCSEVSFIL